jgi:hypothetical protein
VQPQWQSSIRRCEKSGNHPNEDLAKYDYNPNIETFFPDFLAIAALKK